MFQGKSVDDTVELRRIMQMPRRTWTEQELQDLADRMTALLKTPGGTMKLRPEQALALHYLWQNKGLAALMRVGSGKTLVSLLAPYMVGAKRPVLLLPATLIRKTERDFKQLAKHWRIKAPKMISYEMLGRVQGADLLNCDPDFKGWLPDFIGADECFVGSTLVSTAEGLRRIDSIRPGDKVWSYGPEGLTEETVLSAWGSVKDVVVRVQLDQTSYDVTDNHPFLTTAGWVNAGELNVGDRVVCVVPRKVSGTNEGQPLLRDELFCKVAYVSARCSGSGTHQRGGPQDIRSPDSCASEQSSTGGGQFCAHDSTEPDAHAWCQGESQCQPLGPWRLETSRARRKRSRAYRSSAYAFGETGRGLGCRETHAVGQECNTCVHDRHLSRGDEDSSRGGREHAQGAGSERERPPQSTIPSRTRLVRVAGVERRGFDGSGEGTRVYNLHVTGPHTYLLGRGEVVHNCHKLKNRKVARTRRVDRFMDRYPNTIFAGYSGTFMKHGLRDFWHIIRWCLKDKAPVPRTYGEISEWGDAIDEKVPLLARRKPGALLLFCSPEEKKKLPPLQAARLGFQRRLVETPGVVTTPGTAVACSLIISAIPYKMDPKMEGLYAKLRGEMLTPDDWDLMTAIELWRVAREMALGFHGIWDPRPPQPWRVTRKLWAKFVRDQLADSDHLDSELQVKNACARGELPDPEYKAWRDTEPTFNIHTKDVWHDEAALEVCEKWMAEGPGIVWVSHVFFGKELARRTGAEYYRQDGLNDKGEFIEDADCSKPIIASFDACKEGKNLQGDLVRGWKGFSRNLVTAPMSASDDWEQLLGRTHRDGQLEDEVTVDFLLGCKEHWDSWKSALAGAAAARDTLGAPQKLLIADLAVPTQEEIDKLTGSMWVAPPKKKLGSFLDVTI